MPSTIEIKQAMVDLVKATQVITGESVKLDANMKSVEEHIRSGHNVLEKGWLGALAKLTGYQDTLKEGLNIFSDISQKDDAKLSAAKLTQIEDEYRAASAASSSLATALANQMRERSNAIDRIDKAGGVGQAAARKTLADELEGLRKQFNLEIEKGDKAYKNRQLLLNLEDKKKGLIEKWTALEKSHAVLIVPLYYKLFEKMLSHSREMNKQLMDSNAGFWKRWDLLNDIYDVQVATGNEFADMGKAASSLIHYGLQLDSNFKDTLETVVKMEEGLGISYETSAKMARTWQVGLKVSTRDVADSLARMAGNIALSTEEMAKFSTQIGIAMMALGPGMKGSLVGANEQILKMAGAMNKVGGSQEEIIKLYETMTKGTAEGFQMRAFAGVSDPRQLKTQQGVDQAMQGISRYIDSIVRSSEGTATYLAELESASQILGMSAASIIKFKEAMLKSNTALDKDMDLQARWLKQTGEAGEAWKKLKNSLMAVLQQGFMPVLAIFSLIARALTWVIQAAAKFEPVMWGVKVVIVAVSVYAAVAAVSLGLFALSLRKVARDAALAKLGLDVGIGGTGGFFTKAYWKGLWTELNLIRSVKTGLPIPPALPGTMAAPAAGFASSFMGFMRLMARFAGPIVGAAAAGVAIGTLIQKAGQEWNFMFQKSAINRWAEKDLSKQQRAEIHGAVTSGSRVGADDERLKKMIEDNADPKDIAQFIVKSFADLGIVRSGNLTPAQLDAKYTQHIDRASKMMSEVSRRREENANFVNPSDADLVAIETPRLLKEAVDRLDHGNALRRQGNAEGRAASTKFQEQVERHAADSALEELKGTIGLIPMSPGSAVMSYNLWIWHMFTRK